MLNTPFSPWPSFSAAECDAVLTVLRSGRVNYWTGEECRFFEKEFATWCGVKHAVALANGTVALDLALKVLGIGAGDEVVVTPRTFLASVSTVVNAGAIPIFADVDRDSQNISAETILPVLTSRTKAIICVHLAGWPCEMDEILAIAQQHDLFVIEDCAQAHGAKYRGHPVGSMGDIGAWSFCQDKIMTTGGEGGMLTTDNTEFWKMAWAYKDHGKSWDAVNGTVHVPGFKWLHESFGTNWRMIEMQAAIGRLQLVQMSDWHIARRQNASAILEAAAECAVFRVPDVPPHLEHAWYKAYVFVESKRLRAGWTRDRIIAEINLRGVPCGVGSCSEVYLEKAFEGTTFKPPQRLPAARELGETAILFLVHPTLTSAQIEKTREAIREVGLMALA